MVSLDSEEGGGRQLFHTLTFTVQTALEEWTGLTLQPTSIMGIRVFRDGAIIPSHVDRPPLVLTAIIHVAQDVDEDWTMEVRAYHYLIFSCTK